MVYNYISKIKDRNAFYYMIMFVFVMFMSTRVLNVNIAFVFGIVATFYLMFFFEDRDRSVASDFNQEMEHKLITIKSMVKFIPEHFHTDTDIINFFFNIKDFRDYNNKAYDLAVRATDNFLNYKEDIKKGVLHCTENMETAVIFRNNALNHIHTFIYSLPVNKIIDKKLKNNSEFFQLTLRRHIDDMHRICRKQNANPTSSTRFYENRGPRGVLVDQTNFDLFY